MSDELSLFKSKVNTGLAATLSVSKKAENADRLLEELLKGVFSGDEKGLAEGYEYLKSKATGVASKSVQDLLAKFNLEKDGEVALAIANLGFSDSVNGLSLDVMRRVYNGADDKDIFKNPLKRLADKAFKLVELRGTLAEMGINLPTDPDEDHWTKRLFEKFTTVGKFRNEDWSVIEGTMMEDIPGVKEELWESDKKKMKKLWASDLGPQKDIDNFPDIRKDVLDNNIDLDVSSFWEKKDKNSMNHITTNEIDEMAMPGKTKNEMGSIRNKMRTAKVESAKVESAKAESAKKYEMSTDESVEIGRRIKGGSEKLKSLDDLTEITPLIAAVTGVAAPEIALAIAATKIFAQEMEERQKEAEELVRQNEEMAKQARDESIALLARVDITFNADAKKELQEKLATLKSATEAAERFKAVGKNFQGSKVLFDNLNSNAMVLPASKGVIESYKTDEELVASVSGGLALHGLVLVLEDHPVGAGTIPALKQPENVQILGVTQPFTTSTYKTTKETEMSTFKKTASSAGASIATSTSTSIGGSASASFMGVSTKSSSGTTMDDQAAFNTASEQKASEEKNKTTTSAYVSETVLMPMRSARLNYDGMRLSEDAKRAIRKISTEREALHFLRTFGSHLPLGMITLGGSFSRTITMQASKETSETSLYAEAGTQMSSETGASVTSSTSGGASFGFFGLGPKVGASANFSSATKSGRSSSAADASGKGEKTAASDTYFSMDVSSLGPNASTPEQFYTLLNENTGTWAVIDRGNLDEVIPIWDLIKDELLDGAMKVEESKDELLVGVIKPKEGKEEIQIRRAMRLMKRVWARKARAFMSTASPPNLPDLIVRAIEDFVAVDEAVGEMVDAICTVIEPKAKDHEDKGNRVAMFQSLKEVVRAAKDHIIDSHGVFEYGNWWIEKFIKKGMQILDSETAIEAERSYLGFKFTVECNDEKLADADQKEVALIRRAHTRAATASHELTDEGWEQLCDEFVPLAKCSEMRNFWSSDDYQRTAKIYNVHASPGKRTEVLSLQTPISTIKVDPKTSATLHCPDAITSIRVRVSAPFFLDDILKSKTKPATYLQYKRNYVRANETMVYDIYPGVTYYWFRDHSDNSHKIITEEELLGRGMGILINGLPQTVHLNEITHTIGGPSIRSTGMIDLLGHSTLVLNLDKKITKSFASPQDMDGTVIKPGGKYCMYHRGHLNTKLSPAQILPVEDKSDRERRERGSIIISAHGSHRRMHEWKQSKEITLDDGATPEFRILNGVPPQCRDYCLDQFWTMVLTSPPSYPSDSYDPEEATFLIVNKSSKSRLYANVSSETDRDGFGFAKEDQKVEDSQKWQFLPADEDSDRLQNDVDYHIVNALSDRRLGLESDRNGTNETRIVATIPEAYYAISNKFEGADFENRHRWKALPWESLKKIASGYKLPPPLRILSSRQTLPSNEVLEEGGIIVENESKILITLSWIIKKGRARKKYYLSPRSLVYIKQPNGDENDVWDEDLLSFVVQKEVNILVECNGSSVEQIVQPGKKHHIVFPAEDPLCLRMPAVMPINDDKIDRGCLLVRVRVPNTRDPRNPGGTAWRLDFPDPFPYLIARKEGEPTASQYFELENLGHKEYHIISHEGDVVSKFDLKEDYIMGKSIDQPVELALAITFPGKVSTGIFQGETYPKVGKGAVLMSDATHIIEPLSSNEPVTSNIVQKITFCTIKNKTTGKYLHATGKEYVETLDLYHRYLSNVKYEDMKTADSIMGNRETDLKTADKWAIIPRSLVNTKEAKALWE